MAAFDPPENHWAADFDQRLTSSLHYLKDRIENDGERFAEAVRTIEELVPELRQLVLDARFWAEQAKGTR